LLAASTPIPGAALAAAPHLRAGTARSASVRAMKRGSVSITINTSLGWRLYLARRYDQAAM